MSFPHMSMRWLVAWGFLAVFLPLSGGIGWQGVNILFVGDSQCTHMTNFYALLTQKTNDRFVQLGFQVYATFSFDCISWRRIASCHGRDLHSCGPPSATTGSGAVLEYCASQRADIVVSLLGVNNCKLNEMDKGQTRAWWNIETPLDIQDFLDATRVCGPTAKWLAFGSLPGRRGDTVSYTHLRAHETGAYL
eukprot:7556451-Pyramimonas_sp.AAC.2